MDVELPTLEHVLAPPLIVWRYLGSEDVAIERIGRGPVRDSDDAVVESQPRSHG
jgi:hypothetical protein